MTSKFKNIALITLFTFGILLAINVFNFRFLLSFHAFINDKAFALKDNNPADTNIVLVNLGNLNRQDLAELIRKIDAANPKVIGIHACLDKNISTPYDSLLRSVLTSARNLVLLNKEEGSCVFINGPRYGKLSLLKDDDEVVRSFLTDTNQYFEIQIADIFDENSYPKLSDRQTRTEQINYIGNVNHFFALDHDDILGNKTTPDLLKGKIVLIGFLGSTLSMEVKSLESAVYTPLNSKLEAQKVYPDMYGVVVSANTISTIIQNRYIEEVPLFISTLIIICIVIFNLLAGSLILEKSVSNFLLFVITAFVSEVFLSGLLIVWLLNDYQKMLYLQALPVAIIIAFVAYFIIYLKINSKITNSQENLSPAEIDQI